MSELTDLLDARAKRREGATDAWYTFLSTFGRYVFDPIRRHIADNDPTTVALMEDVTLAAEALIQRYGPEQCTYDPECMCEWCVIGRALDALNEAMGGSDG